ncbi:PilN domain-containing protein [Geminocystis sp. NIES-3709]|uniref:PilN domain-containing protein n=1 Tax=Geminocystis sp. NIES-3709 TaxID=1617448 RepID=UPI0005FC74C6|nr:PilN domain-containing protein [Geminocystis sp. NIES-3709]BAQ65105.1 type IV pilus biogenesis protein PilN [Geminocystis sp. NIES-3709]
MYNIDINFLKDRKLDASSGTTAFKKTTPKTIQLPILIGTGVAVGFIAATGGALFFLNNQKAATNKTIAELDAEIQRLQGQNTQVQQIQTEIDAISNEIGILVSVFNQIKPWSAMLSEIGSVTPSGIQIQTINQSGNKSLIINGYADSYDLVNDFLLTLKNSRFLNPEATTLVTTSIADNPGTVVSSRSQIIGNDNIAPTSVDTNTESVNVTLPKVFLYTINTEINDKSSEELLNLLNRRGAIGLVSRLTYLQRKGALRLQPVAEPETKTETPAEGETTQ